MDDINLEEPDFYLSRELSLLEFNRRVLEQAKDKGTPLLERLNFLCISCSNLDEFFEVRFAGLLQKARSGVAPSAADGRQPATELLPHICNKAHALVDEQYRVLNEVVLPALVAENIHFIRRSDWNPSQETWLRRYFEDSLLPVLSPMGLDSAHPFPRILNKGLSFIIALSGKNAFGRDIERAILPVPRALPRIVQLPPSETESGPHTFVFLSSIIHAFIEDLFTGLKVNGCFQFRITRNSELYLDEEEIDDLLHAVEEELSTRNYGEEVRLEVADNCTDEIVEFLLEQCTLPKERLFQVDGPVNLNRIREIYDLIERPELKYPSFTPGVPAELISGTDVFAMIRKQDILLHHPYESFLPVIDFLRQAAADPAVLTVKQTLYRTGPDSPVVDALLAAARAGKEVTVVIELRARFDEQANVELANRLQEAAVQVVYGIVRYKTHAKMLLVLRREGKDIRPYVHLGTGNYHPRTARFYTDYSLFSAQKELGDDVRRVFVQLTSLGRLSHLNKLLQSPFTLHQALLEKIEREMEYARRGVPARIIMKVNALIEPQIIRALYRAAQHGVEVKLIVRGMCSLRPGLPGVSENIEVRSIIGRFLEHSRLYIFHNNGTTEVYGSSADVMERNMFRRVEVGFPILDRRLKQRVLKEVEYYLRDSSRAWILQSDGSYQLSMPPDGEEAFSAQAKLLEELRR